MTTRGALVTGVQTCALPVCLTGQVGSTVKALGEDLAESGVGGLPLVGSTLDSTIQGVDQTANPLAKVNVLDQTLVGSSNPNSQQLLGVSALSPTQSSGRSEEHTSELQSLMRIAYAVFCL